jgi:cytochrome c-type biogenesis protein CcmH/NrfG
MSALKICPTCSVEYPETERFCPKDGAALRWQNGANTTLVGSIVADRYHIIQQLGAGGMGRIYLAEHVKMGRRSAIKVLHPAMAADAEAIARFNSEAANASRIDHPNVAPIYDFGETSDGLLYLAMQYIEGTTLSEILKTGGAMPPLRAVDITRQVAEGLYAAHTLGIVHRDLKPDNIMVTTDHDGIDAVKVVDFGIAKSTGGISKGVTRTGMVIGTVEYMSPEQLAGDALDGRSDQYSLALVAFNMLTGELPFPIASTASTAVMRLTEQPRTLAAVRPDVPWPNEAQAVMSRALDKDPHQRFPSTRDFARELHAAIALMPAATTSGRRTRVVDAASSEATTQAISSGARTAPRKGRGKQMLMIAASVVAIAAIAIGGRRVIQRARGRGALEAGIAAFRQGRRDVARERLVAASNAAPNDPAPHVYLARLARESNDLTTANEEAVKAVRLGPDNGPALRELATTLYATQNFAAARVFYVRAIRADTADHSSQGYLGCSLIQLGRVEEGTRWVRRAGSGTWSTCASSNAIAAAAR